MSSAMRVVVAALLLLAPLCVCQDRRPTISFITQPEIVTDIGGTIEAKCSVQYAQDYPVLWMKLDPVDRNNDLLIREERGGGGGRNGRAELAKDFLFWKVYIHFGSVYATM